MRRLTDEFLARRFAPPAVVIDGDHTIIQFRGDTSPYLGAAPGAASLNIMRMIRPGLEIGLRGAIEEADRLRQPVRREGLWLRQDGDARQVTLAVDPFPVSGADDRHLIVSFEDATQDARRAAPNRSATAPPPDQTVRHDADSTPSAARIADLEQELVATRGYLQGIVADRDEANEALQAMNEEVASSNEELQSINEELATAKEELQATNEELNTLNDELRSQNLELKRVSDELTHLLAGVGAPVLVVDRTFTILRVSAGAEDVFQGQPPIVGSALTSDPSSFDFSQVAAGLEAVAAHGTPKTIPIPRRDGRRFLIRVQPYRGGDGRVDGMALVIVDVEDLEQRVAERTTALRTTSDQLIRFSHSVSHEFRAPIRAMRGYAEALLEEGGPELGPARTHYAEKVIEAAGRLDRLVEGLVSYAQVSNVELPLTAVHVDEAVNGAINALRAEGRTRRAKIAVHMPATVPRVVADLATLTQVIHHLLSNAIQFVSPGVRPKVRVLVEDRGAMVRVWVEDNGIGIPRACHERIFRLFERLNSDAKFGGSGVGVGLAYAKQAMAGMNGAIGVESSEGAGSRFWIDVPAAVPDALLAAAAGARPGSNGNPP